MSRTRLHEIEDQVIKHWHDDSGSPVQLLRDALAEAFRHGVDQAIAKNMYSVGNVQPATAKEEKEFWTCGAHLFQSGLIERGKPCLLCTDWKKSDEFNRRKGERRKWHKLNDYPTKWPSYWLAPYLEKIDRRSGKDRRK
jgi:hypothetical protein